MTDFTFQDGNQQPPGVTKDIQQQRILPIRATKTESGAIIPPSITRETPILSEWDVSTRFSEAFKYEIFQSTAAASLSIMFLTPPVDSEQKLIRNKKIVASGDIPLTLKVFEAATWSSGGLNKSIVCNDRVNDLPFCGTLIASRDGQTGFVTLNAVATYVGSTQITDLGIVDGPLLAYDIIEEFPFYFKPETLYQIIAAKVGTTNGKIGLSWWWSEVPAGK